MNRLLVSKLAAVALLASSTLVAHDERLHKGNALTGEIVSVNADGLQLKTKTDTVKVKFSSKTKFEHDKKTVDKTHVKAGDRAGVIGSKLPTGEVMANEVLLGLLTPNAAAAGTASQSKEK
jgi:hypothetical protein